MSSGAAGSSTSEANNAPPSELQTELCRIETEVESISKELADIASKLDKNKFEYDCLRVKLNIFQAKKFQCRSDIFKLENPERNWSCANFDWSRKLQDLLQSTFKIDSFRPLQLSAMNASLSKKDLILVMPTGGGKSLCYQLPALVSSGLTLVISPLVSLMEDQVMQLKKLGVHSEVLSSSTPREESSRIMKLLKTGKESEKPKLLYVAPEKLAKNKSFMAMLQNIHKGGGLARIAIDEVHCCSDWGHDFRPDYTFLGILRDMFSDVPIMGLTATASDQVVTDVQKILNINHCLVLKAPFNRPNLYYEVRTKSSVQAEWLDEIEQLLKNDFKGQSGIIYAFSIKDTEDLGAELRKRGIKARWYHANMPPELRSSAHSKWLNGDLQVIVATTAFGLGIDKPNVRFVIHHTLSKSIENYYQESGRAGRDGKPAKCILYYRFADYFRLSTLVFTQRTGLSKVANMLEYCIDQTTCRRALLAEHFSDTWKATDECGKMCDHCKDPKTSEERDVTEHCRNVYRLIEHALSQEVRLTANMLFDIWYGKGKPALRLKNVPVPKSPRARMENVVAHLIMKGFLKEDFNYTAYSTTSYLNIGPNSKTVLGANYKRVLMNVAGGSVQKRDAVPNSQGPAAKKVKLFP